MRIRSSAYWLCLLGSLSLAATGYAPVFADWKVRFEPSSPNVAQGPAAGMVLDAEGNPYVIGSVAGAYEAPPPLFASIAGGAAPSLITEATGLMTKYQHDNGVASVTYDTHSSSGWGGNHFAFPRAVAIDGNGIVTVVGQVVYLEMVVPPNPGNTPDLFYFQVNSLTGAYVTVPTKIVRNYAQDVTGMVVNGGNVYVCGNEGSATGNRPFVVKIGTSGTTYWTGSVGERANAIDINASGNRLVVVGETPGTSYTDIVLWRLNAGTMTTHTTYTWDGFGLNDSATSVDMADSVNRCVIGGRADRLNGSNTESNAVMIRLNLSNSSINLNGVPSIVSYQTIASHSNPGEGVAKVVYDDTNAYAVGTYGMSPLVYKANFSTGGPAWHFISTSIGRGADIKMNNGKIFAIGRGQPSAPHEGYEFMAFNSGSGTPTVDTFVYDTIGTEKPADPTALAVYRVPDTTTYRLFGTGGGTDRWFTAAKEVSIP